MAIRRLLSLMLVADEAHPTGLPAYVVLLATIFIAVAVVALFRASFQQRRATSSPTVAVVVLGDLGRSPRMQNHAWCLAQAGYRVHLVGYDDTPCHPRILSDAGIHITPIPAPWVDRHRKKFPGALFLAFAAVKVVGQVWSLVRVVGWEVPGLKVIVQQNPPSIPSLPVLWAVSVVRGAALVVDWHNYGYSLLALGMQTRGAVGRGLVRVSAAVERLFGGLARASFCVSQAMQTDLSTRWSVRPPPIVLYDRPPDTFTPLPLSAKHDTLFRYLGQSLESSSPDADLQPGHHSAFADVLAEASGDEVAWPAGVDRSVREVSVLTAVECADRGRGRGRVVWREGRPALMVTSTSWTADEDFGLLLEALVKYDDAAERWGSRLPPVVVLITGKGPLKASWLRSASRHRFRGVHIRTVFAPAEDYPKLLGCADLGLCLHYSSSGLDLPMKAVDMLGCGLPILAHGFPTLAELLHEGHNALFFDDAASLATALTSVLEGFHDSPGGAPRLCRLRQCAAERRPGSWADEWNSKVKPLMETLMA
ncbi:unnamed protein product [Vitrella brassicaformis CCMP3155]|uniref:Glycosyltransferase subfamily 4-like N-terminal domain-containing protein n=2 Tax=Vitrella brassicaformis TaxID=1169539 RepID=A0A0G4GDV2_VITBC|nr:unnamed protein product [Vitrella brassicaformis CCMP3155]|eukprot:CEM27577.1 unnamed protein product [Vitrella brassicaformis CCMP3155]